MRLRTILLLCLAGALNGATVVDRMAVVFPFEVPLYEKEGVRVSFVGHPLLDVVRATRPREATLMRHGLDVTLGDHDDPVQLLVEVVGVVRTLLPHIEHRRVVARAIPDAVRRR